MVWVKVVRPMQVRRQYAIAAAFGAGGAVASILAGAIAFYNSMTGTGAPIAIAFALPLGALTGLLCLAAGRLAWRLMSNSTTSRPAAAWCGSFLIGALGLAVSWAAFGGVGGWVAVVSIAPPVLLTVLGAVGFYLQYRGPVSAGTDAHV